MSGASSSDELTGDELTGDERWIDDFRALNDPERRRMVERRGDFFIVEGLFALEALVDSRFPIRSLLVASNKADAVRSLVGAAGDGVPTVVRPAADLVDITGFAFHRGVLATAQRLAIPTATEVAKDARRLLITEGVNDHENLGSLFRNAAALGIEGALLDPTTADPLYRRSVRVSLGHVLRVPWGRFGSWPDGLAELQDQGITVVALTPAPDAIDLDELAADPPERTALMVGAEGPGLTKAAMSAADVRARIPIAEGVDSLNVATAAAIAFHQLR